MTGNPLIRWLLGLHDVPPDAAGVRLAWEHAWPLWLSVAGAVAAVAVAWASYRRIAVDRRRRVALASLRAAAIVLLGVLLAGPVLELPREQVEPDAVIVLADRSRSMEVQDVATAGGARESRDAALLRTVRDRAFLGDPGPEHRVAWYGFADGIAPLVRAADGSVDAGAATGDRTLLGTAIEQALGRSAGRPVSAVVLLTDGRTTDAPDRALVRRLQSDGVAVFAVALGADGAVGDAAVGEVQAPRRAFAKDLVPVEATVERRGPMRTRALRIELVDTSSGGVMDHAELAAGAAAGDAPVRDQVQLVAKPGAAGDARWQVRIVHDGGPDLLPANDLRDVPVTLVDRPVRVLYVEGYPRWEYRYLKNLLQREGTVESSVMLLSADRDFAQEGNTPLARLPRTREEFEQFDLVVLGDLPATFFTGEQLAEIRRLVAERGAGLLWVGGARSTPPTWQGTALEDLLPFTGPFELERAPRAVNMVPTPAAAHLGVMRISDDPKAPFPDELAQSSSGWSAMQWAQRVPPAALKPATEVLAQSAQDVDGAPTPLVLAMRYGAGNAMYVATDEVWRWRNGRGEAYPERFWLQLVRALARPSLGVGREAVRVAVEPGRATVGETVRVEVELAPGAMPASVALEAVPEAKGAAPVDLEAKPTGGTGFAATWTPNADGRWKVRLRDPALASRAGAEPAVEVVRSDRELRDAEADRPLLESLARETGGRVLSPADAATLATLLPNRSVRTEHPVRDPLWSSPLALGALLALLASEWIVRRLSRLA